MDIVAMAKVGIKIETCKNLRGIFEELRGKRSNLARIGEKWRQKALDATCTEG